jgi:hypothetical protein
MALRDDLDDDMTEKEAKAKGIANPLFKIPITSMHRARSLMETREFLRRQVGLYTSRTKWFIIVSAYFYVSVRRGISIAGSAVKTSSRRKRIRYGSS